MMPDKLSFLKPLGICPAQPYISKDIQLADLIEWTVNQIGRADIVISTFSTSEEFLRRMYRMKKEGRVLRCELICDLRAARKTITLKHFMQSTFDRVYLSQNHSKVVLLSSGDNQVAIVTSQNQTRGDRYEAGIITSDKFTFNQLQAGLHECVANSILINEFNVYQGPDSENK